MNYVRITKDNIDREHICCAMSGKQSVDKKEWLKQRLVINGILFWKVVLPKYKNAFTK